MPKLEAISPCFIVTSIHTTLAFYCDHLGFEVRVLEPAEAPFFAIIGRDSAQIFLKCERDITPTPNHTRHPHLRWDAYIHTSDPDALAAELATRSTTFYTPLQDTHDGLRGFEVRDPNGYTLFFGRPRE